MRYVELRPPISSLPCGLHEWLEDELDCRGVPSPVIYARYILSLLAQDQLRVTDFLEESLNSKQDRRNSSTLPTLRRTKPRFTLNNYIQEEDAIVLAKHPCSKYSLSWVRKHFPRLSWPGSCQVSCDEIKRHQVVNCISSVVDDPAFDVDSLVDEILERLGKGKNTHLIESNGQNVLLLDSKKDVLNNSPASSGSLAASGPETNTLAVCTSFTLSPTMPESGSHYPTVQAQQKCYNAAFPALGEAPISANDGVQHKSFPNNTLVTLSSEQIGDKKMFSTRPRAPPGFAALTQTVDPLTPPAVPCAAVSTVPKKTSHTIVVVDPPSDVMPKQQLQNTTTGDEQENFLAKFDQLHLLWGNQKTSSGDVVPPVAMQPPQQQNVARPWDDEVNDGLLSAEERRHRLWLPANEDTLWRNDGLQGFASSSDPWAPAGQRVGPLRVQADGERGPSPSVFGCPTLAPSPKPNWSANDGLVSVNEESATTTEDLFTSSKTHFRPIQHEVECPTYEDGSVLSSNEVELPPPIRFRIEEQGILTKLPNSLDSIRSSPEKYMVYRDKEKRSDEDFDDWCLLGPGDLARAEAVGHTIVMGRQVAQPGFTVEEDDGEEEVALKTEYQRPRRMLSTPDELLDIGASSATAVSFQPKFRLHSSKLEKTCQTMEDLAAGEEEYFGSFNEKDESLFGSFGLAANLDGFGGLYASWNGSGDEGGAGSLTQQYFSDDKFAEDGFLDGESGFSDGGGNQFGGSEQFLPVEYIEGELYDAMFGAHALPTASSGNGARRKKHFSGNQPAYRKACSFFLEGSCRRADCKFSHDPSSVICRFWQEGDCFKGDTCPFRHSFEPLPIQDSRPRSFGNGSGNGKRGFGNGPHQHSFRRSRNSSSRNSSGSNGRGSGLHLLGTTSPASEDTSKPQLSQFKSMGFGKKTGLLRSHSHRARQDAARLAKQYKLGSEQDFPSLSSSLPAEETGCAAAAAAVVGNVAVVEKKQRKRGANVIKI